MKHELIECLAVFGKATHPFSGPGDSGSLIRSGRASDAVRIMFGGSEIEDEYQHKVDAPYFTPLEDIPTLCKI